MGHGDMGHGDMGPGAALGHGHEQQHSGEAERGGQSPWNRSPASRVAGRERAQTRLLSLLERDLAFLP